MGIKRINQFPDGSGSLSSDDVFLFMDDPSGSGITKKISLSQISSAIGGGGGSSFQISTIDLHNGGVQNAQVLQFDNTSYQSVITGPTPSSGNTAQRMIIQGQKAQGNGEGGDVYLWGGDSDINGGDIKIYAGDADDPSSGQGGYINIDAGNGFTQGGNIAITAGNSSSQGGNVSVSAGNPSGIVSINNNGNVWSFNSDGTVDLPNSVLDIGADSIDIKSSQYSELWFSSGPSGTPNNSIENINYNTNAYIWAGYDGCYIQNTRNNDGTNPYWSYRWEFTNDGNSYFPGNLLLSNGAITYPDGSIQNSANNIIAGSGVSVSQSSGNITINNKLISDPSGITGATTINNIVQISQTDYDNLPSYDPNTVYIINT